MITKVKLTRVKLDRDGYTKGGQYYGLGKPLYELEVDDGQDARSVLRGVKKYPHTIPHLK